MTRLDLPSERWRSAAPAAAYLLVLVCGALVAYYQLFTSFPHYDDEGSVLVSLQSFVHGGHLYDSVFTQYGPFYFEAFGALFRGTGRAVSTDAGRLVVLGVWLTTGTVFGLAVHRLTSRASIGVATQIVAFGVLPLLVAEPMHPIGLVCLLVAALVGVAAMLPARPALGAAGLGVLIAMLAMTKINIGGLAFVAVLFAAGVTLPGLCERALVRRGAVGLLVGAPLLILFPDRGLDWVQVMGILVTGATVALAATCTTRAPGDGPPARLSGLPFLCWFVGAFAVSVAVIVVAIVALGTSVHGLVHGVLVEPTQLRNVFTIAFQAPSSAINWAIGAALVALAVRRWLQSGVGGGPRAWTASVRLVAGLLTWLSTIGASAIVMAHGSGARLVLPLAFAWLVAVPVPGVATGVGERFVRALLPALAVLETVQAYPVAGTQVYAAALIFVPCGAIMLHDGVREMRAVGRGRGPEFAAWLAGVTRMGSIALVLAFAVATLVRPVQAQHDIWTRSVPLHVHGATKVRLPAEQAAEFSRLTYVLRKTCPQFITYPGFNSLYLWTGIRPPTGLNVGDWVELFDAHTQSRVVRAVQHEPKLCVVRDKSLLDSWTGNRAPPQRPLVRFIEANFVPAGTFANGEYELMRRR